MDKMKNLLRILALGLISNLIFVSCKSKSTAFAIDDAKASVEALAKAGADKYASEEFKKLNDNLTAVLEELKVQDEKIFKNYGKAKDLLAQVKMEAKTLKATIPAKIEATKNAAIQLQGEAKAAIDEAKALLAKAPKGRGTAKDIEAMKAELTGAETAFAEIQIALDAKDYIAAQDKAKSVKEKAVSIPDQIKKAIEKVKIMDYPLFPWPPPQASASEIIPRKLFERKEGTALLKDVDRKITEALDQNGYSENKYYAVPAGFALVTKMEQIEPDGTPKQGQKRWILEQEPLPFPTFSLVDYIKALFGARSGYYRIIVFVVTPYVFTQSEVEVTAEEAKKWFRQGMNKLPTSIGNIDFSHECTCTALIYEFERVSEAQAPRVRINGLISGRTHLIRAGIWEILQQ